MYQLSNWTLRKLPLIQKGQEAEKVETTLKAEIARLRTELQEAETKAQTSESKA